MLYINGNSKKKKTLCCFDTYDKQTKIFLDRLYKINDF